MKTKFLLIAFACIVCASTSHADDPSCGGATAAKQRQAAQSMILLYGYDCQTVDSMCPYAFSEGYTVYCNGFHYTFNLTNHGGKWTVESD
jgi:hypothetical protein